MSINLKDSNYKIKKQLSNLQPFDIARIVEKYDFKDQKRIFQLLNLNKYAKVFIELKEDVQLDYFDEISLNEKKQLLNNIEIDDLKDFIEQFKPKKQEQILQLIKPAKRHDVKKLLIYDEEEAASIMTTEFIKINEDLSIKEATNYVFQNSSDNDFIDIIYVTDENNTLKSAIHLKDLIIARKSDSLSSIAITDYHFVYSHQSVDEAIEIIKNYDLESLPVIDYDNKILGIITADDILDELVLQREEDYLKLANINFDDEDNIRKRTFSRLPWLLIVAFMNLVVASILLFFEKTIETVTVLVLFQPMILGMAGNIGTQSMAVTLLRISDDYFEEKGNSKKHIFKEIMIGIINSIIIAIIGFVVSMSFLYIVKNTDQKPYIIGAIVGVSLLLALIVSSTLGVLVPLFAHKKGINAGNATGPVLSTVNDFVALCVYFLIATIILVH